ncbi:MAG: Mini-ribonuclease 3 [Dethiobacter sp.]|jgi:ribonuclease-3 family protein|nr:Mini-ribonuclease 3 [Dethiobacter sp.]
MGGYTSLPPVLLAYVGDAVFELLIRLSLLEHGTVPVRQLHRLATRYTRASGQSEALRRLKPFLTEEEADIVRRGRNTKTRVPKSAEMGDYRRATGLEALFGYLYLKEDHARLGELLDIIEVREEENL